MRNKSKRVNLLPEPALLSLRTSTAHSANRQSQLPYFEFTFPLADASSLRAPTLSFGTHLETKTGCGEENDSRKELIKQKIKFRVKQEMWNLMKKNYEKPELPSPPVLQQKSVSATERAKPCEPRKENSFSRLKKGSFKLRKYSQINSHRHTNCDRPKDPKDSAKSPDAQSPRHRRMWSSSVKMKDKDRLDLEKAQQRISLSILHLQKLEAIKIEPWIGFEDPEIILD